MSKSKDKWLRSFQVSMEELQLQNQECFFGFIVCSDCLRQPIMN